MTMYNYVHYNAAPGLFACAISACKRNDKYCAKVPYGSNLIVSITSDKVI